MLEKDYLIGWLAGMSIVVDLFFWAVAIISFYRGYIFPAIILGLVVILLSSAIAALFIEALKSYLKDIRRNQ